MQQVLIIEDEPSVASVIRHCLESAGFACQIAPDGESGVQKFREQSPDAIILDLGLPRKNGFDVCSEIRQIPSVKDPMIMVLSSRANEVDRILGYSIGADDYMSKPFSPSELIVRLRAMFRRTHQGSSTTLTFADLLIDVEARQVVITKNQKLEAVALSPLEFDLLVVFAANPKRIWTRDQLLDRLRSSCEECTDRSVDTWISRLRSKLTDPETGDRERFIKTHQRLGYSFEAVSN